MTRTQLNHNYSPYIKRPTSSNKNKYIDYKNVLVTTLRLAKQRYYLNLFQEAQRDIKKTWSHINDVLGLAKKNMFRQEMFHEDTLLVTSKEKADYFNKYFIELPAKISREIPSVQNSFHEYLKLTIDNASLFLRPTSISEILKFVSTLKSTKSSGSHDIAPRIVKECIHVFVEPLCNIFNKSLSQRAVPDKLIKVAKVVPVYKKDDNKNISNYRPIALFTDFF